MIVSGHQPDLLPYSGFFYKMATSSVMDLKLDDQFLRSGYQRRVRMRGAWVTVPTRHCPTRTRIRDVRIDAVEGPRTLARAIHGRYAGSRFYKQRAPEILDRLAESHTDRLWQLNVDLLLAVRDLLGIRTPLGIGPAAVGAKSDGIVSILREYGATAYLSGTGAREYMGDCHEFRQAGIEVLWSKHRAVTGDSILSVLFDYSDPLEVVLQEEPEEPLAAERFQSPELADGVRA